jgi:hypothetical protein
MTLPAVVTRQLAEYECRRRDPAAVQAALAELGTPVPADFREFYETYEGDFGSTQTGYVLRELCEPGTSDDPPWMRESIVSDTRVVRKRFDWPERFLVLSDMVAHAVLVLDASTGRVYDVDFEGGDQELLRGTLEPRWASFSEFLEFFFSDAPARR